MTDLISNRGSGIRSYERILFGMLVMLLIVASMMYVMVAIGRTKRRAESFVNVASALQINATSVHDVQVLATKYGGISADGQCSSGNCSYLFQFSNSWLHFFRLAPYTQLTCTLAFRNGKLYSRLFDFSSGIGPRAYSAVVREIPRLPNGMPGPFNVAKQWSSARWRIYVHLTPDATAEQHREAYGVNLGCLTKIGGCHDAQQLLPTISWGTDL
jgi:hypothetical protein